MEVKSYNLANINDDLRDLARYISTQCMDDIECIYKNFKMIEAIDEKFYRNIIETLFINSYLANYLDVVVCKERSETQIKIIKEYDALKSLDDYIKNLNQDELAYLLCINEAFISETHEERKDYILKLGKKGHELLKKCPSFINDVLYYLKPYFANDILDYYNYYYNNLMKSNFNQGQAFNVSIKKTQEKVIYDMSSLSLDDFKNYKEVLLNLIETYYKYNKYYIDNGATPRPEVKQMMEKIEKNVASFPTISIDNAFILNELTESFIIFNICPNEERNRINHYYENSSLENSSLNQTKVKIHKMRQDIK